MKSKRPDLRRMKSPSELRGLPVPGASTNGCEMPAGRSAARLAFTNARRTQQAISEVCRLVMEPMIPIHRIRSSILHAPSSSVTRPPTLLLSSFAATLPAYEHEAPHRPLFRPDRAVRRTPRDDVHRAVRGQASEPSPFE